MSVEATGIFLLLTSLPMALAALRRRYFVFRVQACPWVVRVRCNIRALSFMKAGEGIFAALMLIFRGGYFVETYGNVFLIGAALFGFKIVEVIALLAICLAPRLVMRPREMLFLDLLNVLHPTKTFQNIGLFSIRKFWNSLEGFLMQLVIGGVCWLRWWSPSSSSDGNSLFRGLCSKHLALKQIFLPVLLVDR